MRIRNAEVHDDLCLRWVSSTDAVLTEPVRFTWHDDQGPQEFLALPGARFDGASVPRLFQWLAPRWGPLNFAALIHDTAFKFRFRLTHDRRVSRKYADQLIYCFARATGCNPLTAYAVRYAVRLLGERRWDRHDAEFR